MEIYTIGFTQKSAEEFFGTLKRAGVRRLLDIRLSNSSQLAGFAKRDDLRFFLREICGIEYEQEPLLAPTEEMLAVFKKGKGNWADYERKFLALLVERQVEEYLDGESFNTPTVLLCSEPTPEHCHRRLVAEYLREKWGDVNIVHL
jgi:uncharacterized protein (DUF488 family)